MKHFTIFARCRTCHQEFVAATREADASVTARDVYAEAREHYHAHMCPTLTQRNFRPSRATGDVVRVLVAECAA